jgi:FMN phosphatase YigB (HAD superfamily)
MQKKKLSKESKKPPVVIFDIDYTVFNTVTFRRNLYLSLAKKLGYSDVEQFFLIAKETEQATKKEAGYFKPGLFIQLLKKYSQTAASIRELENIFFDETLYINSLYTDARSVFQEIVVKREIPVIIFSTGEKEFQLQKITALKEMIHEDRIHIFADKLLQLEEVLTKYAENHIYIVDDLPTILKEAKQFNNEITTIWINRDKSVSEKDFVDNFGADNVIENLGEIVTIVNKS